MKLFLTSPSVLILKIIRHQSLLNPFLPFHSTTISLIIILINSLYCKSLLVDVPASVSPHNSSCILLKHLQLCNPCLYNFYDFPYLKETITCSAEKVKQDVLLAVVANLQKWSPPSEPGLLLAVPSHTESGLALSLMLTNRMPQ